MKKKIVLAAVLCVVAFSVSAQIPAVTLKNINGKTITTDTLNNGGKPFIISFFATWCKPCLRELNAIVDMYPDWVYETGVKIFAVSIDEAQNIAKVKPLADRYGWDYEVLLDPNSDLKRALNIQLIPHVLVFDGNGKIVESRSGYTDGSENNLIEKVREILRKGK